MIKNFPDRLRAFVSNLLIAAQIAGMIAGIIFAAFCLIFTFIDAIFWQFCLMDTVIFSAMVSVGAGGLLLLQFSVLNFFWTMFFYKPKPKEKDAFLQALDSFRPE